MRAVDIIEKKRDNLKLSDVEIEFSDVSISYGSLL